MFVDSYRLEHWGRGPLFSHSPSSSREPSPERWVWQSGHVGPLDKGIKGQRGGQLQQSNVIATGRWLKLCIVIWIIRANNIVQKHPKGDLNVPKLLSCGMASEAKAVCPPAFALTLPARTNTDWRVPVLEVTQWAAVRSHRQERMVQPQLQRHFTDSTYI